MTSDESIKRFIEGVTGGDETRVKEFRSFLREIIKTNWPTHKHVVNEVEHLKKVSGDRLTPGGFIRSFSRLLSGEVSAKSLTRLSQLLGMKSWRALADRFEQRIKASAMGIRGRSDFIANEFAGRYTLRKDTRLAGMYSRKEYVIVDRVIGGKKGESYKAKVEGTQKIVFVKTLNLPLHEEQSIDERINRLMRFIEKEQSNLERLEGVKGVAQFVDHAVADLSIDGQEKKKVPCIVHQYISGDNLDVYLEAIAKRNGSVFSGLASGSQWVGWTRELLGIVRDIHIRGVRHGDLRPDNIRVHRNHLCLIDFAQSALASPVKSTHHRELRDSPYTAPERRRNPENPLEVSEDIYSLGGVLLWLASGKGPPLRKFVRVGREKLDLSDGDDLKKYIESEINPNLEEYRHVIVHVICRCLQYRVDARASHADDVLRTLESFEIMRGHKRLTDSSHLDDIASLKKLMVEVSTDPLFSRMIREDVSFVMRRVRDMISSKRVEIEGTREHIIAALLGYMSILSGGDSYVTATTINYWRPDNLGISGRFLAANEMIARSGVSVRRVFIVTPREEVGDPFRKIVAAQKEVIDRLRKMSITCDDKKIDGDGYYVGYIVRDKKKIDEMVQGGYHAGIIRRDRDAVSLSFREDAGGLIRRIYIWNLGRRDVESRLMEIADWLDESRPIGIVPLSI